MSYPIAGMTCRSFKLEDHLLLLSYHAAQHHLFKYVGPRPLLDLAQVLTWAPQTVDWQDLSRRSRQLGWDKGLELMLTLVEDVTGLSPPASLNRLWAVEPRVTLDIRRLALEAMILDVDHKVAIGNRVLKVFQRPGIGERLAHVTERLIPAPKLMLEYAQVTRAQIRHRPWQWPLLYLHRWLRFVRDLVPKLLELACGDQDRRAELKRSARLQAWLHGRDP